MNSMINLVNSLEILQNFYTQLCHDPSNAVSESNLNALTSAFQNLDQSLDVIDSKDELHMKWKRMILKCTRSVCTMHPKYQIQFSTYLVKKNWISILSSLDIQLINLYLQTLSNSMTGNKELKLNHHSYVLSSDFILNILSLNDELLFSTLCVLILNVTMNEYDISMQFLQSDASLRFIQYISKSHFQNDLTHYQVIAVYKNCIHLDLIYILLSKLFHVSPTNDADGSNDDAKIYILNLILELSQIQDFDWNSLPCLCQWMVSCLCHMDLKKDVQVMRYILDCISEFTIYSRVEDKDNWGVLDSLISFLLNLLVELDTNHSDEYTSFKTLVLKILANMAFGSSVIQDEIRKLHGIPLILNQCKIDDRHPYTREYAIFAIHNLMQGNRENQDLLDSLKPQGMASNDFLKNLNLKAVLDEDSYKVKLMPIEE